MSNLLPLMAAIGAANRKKKAIGQIEYTTPGTYTFTVPVGVYSVSVVCIGGSEQSIAGSYKDSSFDMSYIAYGNDGQTGGGFSPYGDGGGNGGNGGGRASATYGAARYYSAGGGGGAGGYSGAGGVGGTGNVNGTESSAQRRANGGSGGGVGIYGEGGSGVGGLKPVHLADNVTLGGSGSGGSGGGGSGGFSDVFGAYHGYTGTGGSGGQPTTSSKTMSPQLYGGGIGGSAAAALERGAGGGGLVYKNNITVTPGQQIPVQVGQTNGAVRIIWPGDERQFPSTRTADEVE